MRNSFNRLFGLFINLLLICLVFFSKAGYAQSSDYLSGKVFNGNKGDESTAISGVTVKLYGSMNSGTLGSQINSTTTDGNGWYSLLATSGYEYYSIVETDPSGYQSVGASSVSGTVINSNRIQYSIGSKPLSGQTKTGNKFWDKPTAPANHSPNAVDDNASTKKNTAVTISVLANDSDPDGDTITLQSKTSASHGTVTKSGNKIIYTPNTGYTGTDQFDYTISDGRGGTDTATVTVTVTEASVQTGSIGDWIWLDLDEDGLQDAGETGIANVTISLYDGSDNLLASTSTDGSGNYLFSNLNPDDYYLIVTLPAGYQFVPQDQGMDDTIDSDANSTTGRIDVSSLTGGENRDYMDAGMMSEDDNHYDFGDAPYDGSTHLYPTNLAQNGARHQLDPDVYLGMQIDTELDGIPMSNALGDDTDGYNDEDGVVFTSPLVPGTTASVTVTASTYGLLYGWIDFKQDGQFDVATDHIFTGQALSPGANVLGIAVPADAIQGWTYARFRFSTSSVLDPEGEAPDGEVEDYAIEIIEAEEGSVIIIKEAIPADNTQFLLCTHHSGGFFNILCGSWSDPSSNQLFFFNPGNLLSAQEGTVTGWVLSDIQVTGDLDNGSVVDLSNREVTIDFDPGENIVITFKNEKSDDTEYDFGDAPTNYPSASHLLDGPYLGWLTGAPDAEGGMQHTSDASGDDQDGYDDEQGFNVFTSTTHVPGGYWGVDLDITLNQCKGFTVALWIDWNKDYDWNDAQEEIFSYSTSTAWMGQTFQILSIKTAIPATITPGDLFARVRLVDGENVALTPDGAFGKGEIQDHVIHIVEGPVPDPSGGRIYGMKWDDKNGNKIWDMTESALSGWTIWLDLNQNGVEDAGDAYDITDGSGQFEFSGLNAGQYIVGEKLKSGWIQTWPGSPATHTMTVDPQKPGLGILFGNQQTGPNSGGSAVKWDQSLLFDIMSEDTTCYRSRRESSVMSESIMADNWFCYNPKPVTGIRWWGAYADWDSLMPPENAPDYFHIGIWTHTTEDEVYEFTHPGELIREWFLERSQVQEMAAKSFYDSETMEKPGSVFQYQFNIEPDAWFYQEGESNIYWIHIAAVYDEIPDCHHWGWLTREHYYHEDAERINLPNDPHPGAMFEEGVPIGSYRDMAFILFTNEMESEFDFGDAPDIGFGTTTAKNGALHLIGSDIYLGEQIDADYDGQPHSQANGDDEDGFDDEDGVEIICPTVVGGIPQIQVQVSAHGFLNAWMDVDQNGQWIEPEDHIIQNAELEAGIHIFKISVFNNITAGEYMSRFRFSSEPYLWFRGFAIDGEVEDHLLHLDFTGVNQRSSVIPKEYQLYQNFPNPFNPCTTIVYDIAEKTKVIITIYNTAGQQIACLVSQEQRPGRYCVTWRGQDMHGRAVSSGVYLCRMKTTSFIKTNKLIYMR